MSEINEQDKSVIRRRKVAGILVNRGVELSDLPPAKREQIKRLCA